MFDFFSRLFNDDELDAAPLPASVPQDVQTQIVKIMNSEYGDNPVPFAIMGLLLKKSGIEPSDYGYEKLKPFLSACSDSIVVEINPETGHPMARINRESALGSMLQPNRADNSIDNPTENAGESVALRHVSPGLQARVASAIGYSFGYDTPVLLAYISPVLKEAGISFTALGFKKLKDFLLACSDVIVIGSDSETGHPTASARRLNSSQSLAKGTIIHRGANVTGADYGIVQGESGAKYLFYDVGVEGSLGVGDFSEGDSVLFTLFTNARNGRTYASRVQHANNAQLTSTSRAASSAAQTAQTVQTAQAIQQQPQLIVDDEVQRELYGPLVQRFGFTDEPYPLASFGAFLNDIFFDYTQYGFEKAKPFALGLDKILEVSYAEFGDLVHPYFKLKRYSPWLSDISSSEARTAGLTGATSGSQLSTAVVEQVLQETRRPDGARSYSTKKQVPDRLALAAFSMFDDWNGALGELAELALPEKWSFGKSGKLEILDSYLRYTFVRLKKEGKVLVSDDGQSAAFNTGLVDKLYEDIFACFTKDETRRTMWHFEGFCTQASFTGPAACLDRFTPLPEPAAYFDNPADLLFDPKVRMHLNYDHIIIENIERLPIAFLRNELSQFDEAAGYLRQLDALQADESDDAEEALEEVYESLAAFIESQPRCMRRLIGRMKDAVESAEKRARWNYKTAVPLYYPRTNSISLLLPLDLTDDGTTDVALVVERNEDVRFYRGRTIYTLDMAYKNARLVCRLDNDWLVAANQ